MTNRWVASLPYPVSERGREGGKDGGREGGRNYKKA